MRFRGLCFSVSVPADEYNKAEPGWENRMEFQLALGNEIQLFPSFMNFWVMQAIFHDTHSFMVCFLCAPAGAEIKFSGTWVILAAVGRQKGMTLLR